MCSISIEWQKIKNPAPSCKWKKHRFYGRVRREGIPSPKQQIFSFLLCRPVPHSLGKEVNNSTLRAIK